MLTRRFVLGGLIAAPAVITADKLMPVKSIIKPYATVWGVGWDLGVVEHVVWTPKDALMFAHFNGGLGKFREVTEVVYANPLPWPLAYSNHWTERPNATQEWFASQRKALVDDATGFTNVAGYGALEEWKLEKEAKMFNDTKHLTIKSLNI
jgi:hypothetical protein